MALNLTLTLTANNTPSPSNIIPGGSVTANGESKTAALAAIDAVLETRKASFQGNVDTINSVQAALGL